MLSHILSLNTHGQDHQRLLVLSIKGHFQLTNVDISERRYFIHFCGDHPHRVFHFERSYTHLSIDAAMPQSTKSNFTAKL